MGIDIRSAKKTYYQDERRWSSEGMLNEQWKQEVADRQLSPLPNILDDGSAGAGRGTLALRPQREQLLYLSVES